MFAWTLSLVIFVESIADWIQPFVVQMASVWNMTPILPCPFVFPFKETANAFPQKKWVVRMDRSTNWTLVDSLVSS
jgi:hypothetical protein